MSSQSPTSGSGGFPAGGPSGPVPAPTTPPSVSQPAPVSQTPQPIPVPQPAAAEPVVIVPAKPDLFNVTLSIKDTSQYFSVIASNKDKFSAKTFVDSISYKGFERTVFIIAAAALISASQMIRLALIGAIRGANFEKIVKSSETIDKDLVDLVGKGVVKRNAVGPNDITILRCTAALPQWCAYFLAEATVPKKLANLECPGFLQFPAAASLPMSRELRIQHIEFSIMFSKTIKGTFNENIYITMMNNLIPVKEIPVTLALVLGVHDPSFDATKTIEEYKKKLGTEVVKKD